MKVTISTHNGSRAARDHNIRNQKVVSKENHIDENGIYEIWHDEKPHEAYERIFGEAKKEYNEKQKRSDRKIDSYYNVVKKDKKKNTVYEMIIGVYGKDENGQSICSESKSKKIMKEFVDGWKDRNPNLELIGAYYHADEEGEPHVHIDYVPVAHEYSKGMKTQNGLVKAFKEMGIEKQQKFTAQIIWEARENKFLESICEKNGLEVDHPTKEKVEHVETNVYKAKKTLESIEENIERYSSMSGLEQTMEISKLEAENQKLKKENKNLKNIINLICEKFPVIKDFINSKMYNKKRKELER